MPTAQYRTGRNRERLDRASRDRHERAVQAAAAPPPHRRTQPEQRAHIIATYVPAGIDSAEWEPIRQFMAPLLERAALTPASTRRILATVATTALRPQRAGAPLTVETVIGKDAVGLFLSTRGAGLSNKDRRDFKGAAAQLGRALGLRDYVPVQVHPVGRTRAALPYTATEERLYYEAVAEIPSPAARDDALTLLNLTFGAGLTSGQAVDLCGTDVQKWARHVIVRVPGRDGLIDRLARSEAADQLLERAAHVDTAHMVRPNLSRGRCIEEVANAIERADPWLPRFRVTSASNAYWVEFLTRIGVAAAFGALDIDFSSHRLNDLLRDHDTPTRDAVLNAMSVMAPHLRQHP
ncbi:hypothetical protein CTKZ_08870 [Cellulomonas algicola]|uniref:Tyr recombinase domain-containing protein n=1 Tax=Cellulomonas algicola TaxID=2071633 RepID=A0A401UXC9_9CELL|nr:hypothetical protein [Cellulomonas algicola]GCD19325.1 hypothetical protein CTKZ_08870 [Cellulomonas algicola]